MSEVTRRVAFCGLAEKKPQRADSDLEEVSTTCGSGWVHMQLESYAALCSRTHPLPQVVLTSSNNDF